MNAPLVLATTRCRAGSRLDRVFPGREDPGVPVVTALIRLAQEQASCDKRISPEGSPTPTPWISGGEPTLRPDLPRLLAAAPGVGLATDGLALADERVAAHLRDQGLGAVRIALHSARTDAHDWLVGLPGAARRALLAIRACLAVGLHVEADVVVTRPTTPHLAETVDLLTRLGVHGVRFRRVERRGPAAEDFVAISPRFGLLEPFLEAAVALAVQRGVAVAVAGFPPSLGTRWVAPHAAPEAWIVPPELADLAPLLAPIPLRDGTPTDYAEVFGADEVASERLPSTDSPEPERSPTQVAGTGRKLRVVPPPPVRGERTPGTRVAFASRQASRRLDGDPMAGVPRGAVPEEVRVTWTADEPTRPIRQRLVRAAQVGAARLRLDGPELLAHPNAPELLREALRLSFPEVLVEATGDAFDAWTDAELRRLRGIALSVDRIGPGLERLRTLATVDLRVR